MPMVWFGNLLFTFPHNVQKNTGGTEPQSCTLAGCIQAFLCLRAKELHYLGGCAAFIGAAAEHRLPATKGGGEGCSLRSYTEDCGLHSFIVLHRAFLPCSLTCSVTNYSLIAGWQKKSFTAPRLFLTNQVTEALKIILSRKEAP